MCRAFMKHCTALVVCMASWSSAPAADAQTPAAASVALYERISARDLDGVQSLLPPAGFSEAGADGAAIHRLDRQAFEAFFNSGAEIALHAEDLKTQVFGDTAVVTGIRVGSIAPRGGTAAEERRLFTMVWMKEGQAWKLRHLHLSGLK